MINRPPCASSIWVLLTGHSTSWTASVLVPSTGHSLSRAELFSAGPSLCWSSNCLTMVQGLEGNLYSATWSTSSYSIFTGVCRTVALLSSSPLDTVSQKDLYLLFLTTWSHRCYHYCWWLQLWLVSGQSWSILALSLLNLPEAYGIFSTEAIHVASLLPKPYHVCRNNIEVQQLIESGCMNLFSIPGENSTVEVKLKLLWGSNFFHLKIQWTLIECVISLKNQYCYWRREKDEIVVHLSKSIKVEMFLKFLKRNNYIERISLVWRLSWSKFQHQKSITTLSVLSLFCLFPLEIYFCAKDKIR